MKADILESIETKQKLLEPNYLETIENIGRVMIEAMKNDNIIYMAGNGGSAADAQHFAAELAGKFEKKRRGLPALALTTNTSNITAIGNDFSYDEIFSRQIQALGRKGDIFLGITTSGNSKNILLALETARLLGMKTIGLLGCGGGRAQELCDFSVIVPSERTSRIQECHILIIHILSKKIDGAFV